MSMYPASSFLRRQRRSLSRTPNISATRSSPRAAAPSPVRLLVIEASGMIEIDYTGSQTLQQMIAELRARSIEVAMARLSDQRAQAEAKRTGLITALGSERVFKSVEEAVRQIVPNAKA